MLVCSKGNFFFELYKIGKNIYILPFLYKLFGLCLFALVVIVFIFNVDYTLITKLRHQGLLVDKNHLDNPPSIKYSNIELFLFFFFTNNRVIIVCF